MAVHTNDRDHFRVVMCTLRHFRLMLCTDKNSLFATFMLAQKDTPSFFLQELDESFSFVESFLYFSLGELLRSTRLIATNNKPVDNTIPQAIESYEALTFFLTYDPILRKTV